MCAYVYSPEPAFCDRLTVIHANVAYRYGYACHSVGVSVGVSVGISISISISISIGVSVSVGVGVLL